MSASSSESISLFLWPWWSWCSSCPFDSFLGESIRQRQLKFPLRFRPAEYFCLFDHSLRQDDRHLKSKCKKFSWQSSELWERRAPQMVNGIFQEFRHAQNDLPESRLLLIGSCGLALISAKGHLLSSMASLLHWKLALSSQWSRPWGVLLSFLFTSSSFRWCPKHRATITVSGGRDWRRELFGRNCSKREARIRDYADSASLMPPTQRSPRKEYMVPEPPFWTALASKGGLWASPLLSYPVRTSVCCL